LIVAPPVVLEFHAIFARAAPPGTPPFIFLLNEWDHVRFSWFPVGPRVGFLFVSPFWRIFETLPLDEEPVRWFFFLSCPVVPWTPFDGSGGRFSTLDASRLFFQSTLLSSGSQCFPPSSFLRPPHARALPLYFNPDLDIVVLLVVFFPFVSHHSSPVR